ncbi:hypothetical protein L3O47_004485 [Salmonella enterica subsp. enterica serovar Typhimurium]|nr:hypothetical protein [Salmonella enterica subsp. enterica serovar Typhimurium]
MNQLSKSWLQAQIAQLESDGQREDAYRPDENGHMTLAAFRAALASLESEPVYQCQFAYKNHSGETEWVWEDVSQEFYEQFNSGGRLGEQRVLYTGPLSAPGVPGAASNDVASVEIQVKAIEQAVNAVLSVDTVASTMTVRALFMNYIGALQLRAEVSE